MNAPSADVLADEQANDELVHYEVDCPECDTHYEIDCPSGPLIFDCGKCGCSFTVEEQTGFRKSGSQAQAAEAVSPMRSGRSKKGRLSKRAALSISKQKEKHPWLNSVLSFAVATILCVGFVVYLIMKSFDERSIETTTQPVESVPELPDPADESVDEPEDRFVVRVLSDNEAGNFISMLERYVSAPTWEEKAKYCRFPGLTKVRMQQHYANRIYEAYSIQDLERVGPVQLVATASGQSFFQVGFRDKSGEESFFVGEPMGQGLFAFEWEPTVLFSEVPWENVENGMIDQPVAALVRIQKSTRYSAELSLEKFASYQVYRKGLADGFVAYAELGSEVEKTLAKIFDADQFPLIGVDERPSTKHVMLKFMFPQQWNPAGDSRYARIMEVVQADWVRYEK